jgi:hypothetical protein
MKMSMKHTQHIYPTFFDFFKIRFTDFKKHFDVKFLVILV